MDALSGSDYAALALFRFRLRAFLRVSEELAREAGVEPQHHQLMLTLRGLGKDDTASVADLASWLQLRHHSVVELVDRAVERHLVARHPDPADARRVLVTLTEHGDETLAALSRRHRGELRVSGPQLLEALRQLLEDLPSTPLVPTGDLPTPHASRIQS